MWHSFESFDFGLLIFDYITCSIYVLKFLIFVSMADWLSLLERDALEKKDGGSRPAKMFGRSKTSSPS